MLGNVSPSATRPSRPIILSSASSKNENSMFDSEIQSGEKSGEKSDLKHARKTKTTSFTINKANLFELPKLERDLVSKVLSRRSTYATN